LKTVRNIVPHHAAKSTIVRGALKTFWFANPRNKGWRAHSFAAAEIRGNVVDHMLKVHAA
jgi:hypothetical protein